MGERLCTELKSTLGVVSSQESFAPIFKCRSLGTQPHIHYQQGRCLLAIIPCHKGQSGLGGRQGGAVGEGERAPVKDARRGSSCTGCCLAAGPGSSRPGCDGESITRRNGATAYQGNKERQRRRIFICPSPHSGRRCFITEVGCEITLFPTPEQREPFVWAVGRTIWPVRRTQPPGSPPLAEPNRLLPSPMGGGARKTSPALPQLPLVSPLVASLQGDEQNLTF